MIDSPSQTLSVITVGIISGALLSVLGALVVGRLGLWRQTGLIGRPARPVSLLWFLPFVVYGLLPLTQGADMTAELAAGAAVFGFLIAFWKLVVLGLLIYAWLPSGERSAAALAATFWATMHLGGIFTGGIVVPTLLLCLSYIFLAFAFGAVRLRTGLFWPLIVSYALLLAGAVAVQDGEASNLVPSVAAIVPAVVISALLASFGLLALPRHKQPVEQRPHHDVGADV